MQISTERIQGGRAFPSVAALLAERADVTGRLDPLAVLTLADADVSVWIMRLEDGQESLRAARAILSPSERVRCDRVIDPLRRGRLVLARASLRVILAQELNVTVGEVRIHRSNAGRPALDGEDVPSFSLSHTGEWAAVAVSSLARVGIDIEGAGRPISLTLIDRLLTPAEASSSARESPLSRRRAFLAHWTAKEACAKVLDGGLASNLHRLELGDGLTTRPRLLDHALADVEVRRLDLGPRLIGALAGIGTESSSVAGDQAPAMR